MGASGSSRLVLSEATRKGKSYSEINADFANENEKAKVKKIPLGRDLTEHNHSK